MNAPASITISLVRVADLLAEGERMPAYVYVIDHPDARVLATRHDRAAPGGGRPRSLPPSLEQLISIAFPKAAPLGWAVPRRASAADPTSTTRVQCPSPATCCCVWDSTYTQTVPVATPSEQLRTLSRVATFCSVRDTLGAWGWSGTFPPQTWSFRPTTYRAPSGSRAGFAPHRCSSSRSDRTKRSRACGTGH